MIENNWITLVKPNKVDYKISENKKFGTVVIEPLEKGFGTTLGNALRRVLLSSLQGTAITSIKINGVLHEFSTIEGVREDVTDIIMNLKNVTFNSKSNHTQKLTLNVKGPKEVLSSDFDENPEVEIVDKDTIIMNVDTNREVNLEIFLDVNKGYISSEKNKDNENKSVGQIMLDATFSPVKRVAFSVDNSRIGQDTEFDKLILDIETNGALHSGVINDTEVLPRISVTRNLENDSMAYLTISKGFEPGGLNGSTPILGPDGTPTLCIS